LIALSKLYLSGEHTMSELVTKSVPQEQQEQKLETRTGVARIAGFALIATAVAVLAILGAVVLHAQSQNNDKYPLKLPDCGKYNITGLRVSVWLLPPQSQPAVYAVRIDV
jgi:hypothetical protein